MSFLNRLKLNPYPKLLAKIGKIIQLGYWGILWHI